MDRSLQRRVQTLAMARLFLEQQQRMVAQGRRRHVVVVRKTPMAKMVDENLFEAVWIAEPTTTTTALLPDATGSTDDDQADTTESKEPTPTQKLQQEETRLVQVYLAFDSNFDQNYQLFQTNVQGRQTTFFMAVIQEPTDDARSRHVLSVDYVVPWNRHDNHPEKEEDFHVCLLFRRGRKPFSRVEFPLWDAVVRFFWRPGLWNKEEIRTIRYV